jgi:hypothetical protein
MLAKRTLLALLIVASPMVAGQLPRALADSPYCAGTATSVGTSGDDVLLGTDGSDLIVGLAGRDRIEGDAGRDTLCGGTQADLLQGGPDSDRLAGGPGPDEVRGGTAGDFVFGGGGPDDVRGDDGPDFIDGGAGIDVARGGQGIDYCVAAERLVGCEWSGLDLGKWALVAAGQVAVEYFEDHGTFDGFGPATAPDFSPVIAWSPGGTAPFIQQVNIEVATSNVVLLTTMGLDGNYLCWSWASYPVTWRAVSPTYAGIDSIPKCAASTPW